MKFVFYMSFMPLCLCSYVFWIGSGAKRGHVARALQRAHVFAARKVRWTLRLSGSALRIAFARYALSAKAGLAPAFVVRFAQKGTNAGLILMFLCFDLLIILLCIWYCLIH